MFGEFRLMMHVENVRNVCHCYWQGVCCVIVHQKRGRGGGENDRDNYCGA